MPVEVAMEKMHSVYDESPGEFLATHEGGLGVPSPADDVEASTMAFRILLAIMAFSAGMIVCAGVIAYFLVR